MDEFDLKGHAPSPSKEEIDDHLQQYLGTELMVNTDDEFYNFYAIPWRSDAYVKFLSKGIHINPNTSGLAFSSHEYDESNEMLDKRITSFMESCYLGTARLSDTWRIASITGPLHEIVLPND